MIAVGLTLAAWVLSGFLLRSLNSGEILPGTSVGGIDLGGKTRERAAELLAELDPVIVEVAGPRSSFTIEAPEAGLRIDLGASVERAHDAGRSGIGAMLSGPLSQFVDRRLEPVYEPIDSKRLEGTIDRIAERVEREPFVGALSIDRDTLEVATERPKPGIRVRRDETEDALVAAFEVGRESIDVPVRRDPAPSLSEVESVARAAQRYLKRPLVVRAAGQTIELPPGRVAGLLGIESTEGQGASSIRLGIDEARVAAVVARIAARRDRPARDARIDAPSQPPVTLSDQGDLSWRPRPDAASVKRARDGRRIRQRQAAEAIAEAVRDGEHLVRLPVERVEPAVPTATVRAATSLLGTFTTSYSCCQPRVDNIQRMAEVVDGTVIGTGEQFSLNSIAGERTRESGYLPAPTIGEGNELIDTVGGGVSQFSTTTYNAAYFAGLQIDAHTPHSFYISRYPPGRESTLNFGSIDLLWTNDTKAPVVVRASASDTSVTVSIYGSNGGRRVRARTLSRSANSLGAFDITVERIVVRANGSRTREPFTTAYGTPAD